jgi:hypothetical protein
MALKRFISLTLYRAFNGRVISGAAMRILWDIGFLVRRSSSVCQRIKAVIDLGRIRVFSQQKQLYKVTEI